MKLIHGSLAGLLRDVAQHKVQAVRIATLTQIEAPPAGCPRYTSWVAVTATLDWDLWTEWRLLVGRGRAEVAEQGFDVPASVVELSKQRYDEVRKRLEEAGLGVQGGVLAPDTETMDGVLD